MGVPKEQALRNRQAIIDTASRVFRERGVDGVGLADLMKEAGFTHGGFYNHFKSKEALASEACASAFANGAATLRDAVAADPGGRADALRALMEGYLSPEHCEGPGTGCPMAALAVDAARQGKEMQIAYANGIEAFLQAIAPIFCSDSGGSADAQEPVQSQEAREGAIELLASLVGTIVLARGVGPAIPRLAEEILAAGRKHVLGSRPEATAPHKS